MVSREIVMGTIKRMHDAGIDNETVKSSLIDIGLSDSEISGYMVEAGLEEPRAAAQRKEEASLNEEPSEALPEEGAVEKGGEDASSDELSDDSLGDELSLEEEHDMIADKTAEKLRPHLDSLRQEQGMRDTSYRLDSDEHRERLSSIDSKLDDISSTAPRQEHIAELTARIKALEEITFAMQKDLGEVKAATTALQSLLTKILDTDRQTLIAISKKK